MQDGGGREGEEETWRVGGTEYQIDAEEGGSYEAGLQGSLEMVTMPWAGQDGVAGISVDRRRFLQGGYSYRGGYQIVCGENIRLGGVNSQPEGWKGWGAGAFT